MPPFDPTQWQQQRQLAEFDRLLVGLRTWVDGLPPWEPFERTQALWARVSPRLTELQVNLDRVLVVGVVGGSGTGKSTLINAIVGSRVCKAGDVERPTTKRPVIVHHPSVDPSFIPLADERPELIAVAMPLLENLILVDCPDPDTQMTDTPSAGDTLSLAERRRQAEEEANHNRDLLRRVLPHCDVLVHVGTAQKYKTQAVAEELLRFAPGRQVVFVQTHGTIDADIRDDWRRHLESAGFVVPTLFRVDSERALVRQEGGEAPDAEFRTLLDFLQRELAERGRHRIKRANVLDLAEWFLENAQHEVQATQPRLDGLEQAIHEEEAQLLTKVKSRLHEQLSESRHLWRVRLLREVTRRWGGGPFASFVRLVSSAGTLWRLLPLTRARGLAPLVIAGGVGAGKAVIEQWRENLSSSEWVAAADLGVSDADLAESQSVLESLARDAGLDWRGPTRASVSSRSEAAQASLVQLARQLHAQIENSLADVAQNRSRRRAGRFFHFLLEVLFIALPAFLLYRLGYNFFYEHVWDNRPIYGLEFVIQAVLWTVVWGLLLRGWLIWRLQRGLQRDINRLVETLEPRALLGGLFDDLVGELDSVRTNIATLARLKEQAAALRIELFAERDDWQLGRLRTA